MNADKPTGDVYPGKGLAIKQLLHTLRVEVSQHMSVHLQVPSIAVSSHLPPTSLHRPPDMTAQDVYGPPFPFLLPLTYRSPGSGMGRGSSSHGRRCAAPLEHFQHCRSTPPRRPLHNPFIPSRRPRLVRNLPGLPSLANGGDLIPAVVEADRLSEPEPDSYWP